MKKAILILATMAACSSTPKPTPEERDVQAAFERFRAALLEGDAGKTFALISDGNKSEWLYQRMTGEDQIMRARRGQLSGSARVDLDLWFEFVKKNRKSRAETLPPTVLAHPWLREVWNDYFALDREAVMKQAPALVFTNAYVDATGATVVARNAMGNTELYQMVPEGGAWKVDGHRESIRQMPK